jgi:hypothetical protein
MVITGISMALVVVAISVMWIAIVYERTMLTFGHSYKNYTVKKLKCSKIRLGLKKIGTGGKLMDNYNVTRRVATKITDRFSSMLRNLEDDFEEEIVVCCLMKYYNLCSVPVKDEGGMDMGVDEDLLWAIERILQDFMGPSDFNAWMLSVKENNNGR